MSRSWAKRYRFCKTYKICKRFANKKIRKIANIINGKFYKRCYCSWNINDSGKSKYIPKLKNYNCNNEWIIKAKRK